MKRLPERSVVCLIALVASLSAACADDARSVPAVGSKLTYRFVSSTTTPRVQVTAGEIYTYIVTAGDAASAEGIIKPVAVILRCKAGADNPDCHAGLLAPNAHLDGDLLTVPIASDVGDALAKQSHFKMTYIVQEERKFPLPELRDAAHGGIGPDPAMVLINTMHCDLAGLSAFLPVGAAPHVALPCESRFERPAAPDGHLPALTVSSKISADFSYTGSDSVTLPSGTWDVKKLVIKMIPDDSKKPGSEGEILFSPKLGTTVRTRITARNPATQSATESTSELISVTP